MLTMCVWKLTGFFVSTWLQGASDNWTCYNLFRMFNNSGAYYAIDPASPMFILAIKMKIMIINFIKHYNNNIIILFYSLS